MNLHSVIKRLINFIILSSCLFVYAQENESTEIDSNTQNEIKSRSERQKFGSFSLGYHQPISTGDNFVGLGLEGKSGLNFSLQFYAYKQVIIGFATNSSYFEVSDRTIVGNYKKTTINEQYFFIGYEFLPTDRLRLGIVASIFGDARYKNKYSSQPNEVYQIDRGKLGSYGFNIKYEVGPSFMLYIDYAYRSGKTDIKAPTELRAIFEKATYHNIGIGLTFSIGSLDMFSTFIE